MTPDPNTAYLFDILVDKAKFIAAAKDISLAAAEFSMGFPVENRVLDVCFGFNKKISDNTINVNKDLVVGRGIYRLNGTEQYNKYNTAETILDIRSSLVGLPAMDNVYLFGEVYLKYSGGTLTFEFKLVKPNEFGLPLMMVRDIAEDDVIEWVRDGNIKFSTTPSSPTSMYMLLYRVIINVEKYVGTPDSILNDIDIIVVDERKPRGWAGFSEENMAALIPYLIKFKDDINGISNNLDVVVKDMVDKWLKLDWPNGFVDYWNSIKSTVVLPIGLYEYIVNNFTGYDGLYQGAAEIPVMDDLVNIYDIDRVLLPEDNRTNAVFRNIKTLHTNLDYDYINFRHDYDVNAIDNIITLQECNFVNGDKVRFKKIGNSKLPTPLMENTDYYVIKNTTLGVDEYKFSTSLNGVAVDLTDVGSDINSVYLYDFNRLNTFVTNNSADINFIETTASNLSLELSKLNPNMFDAIWDNIEVLEPIGVLDNLLNLYVDIQYMYNKFIPIYKQVSYVDADSNIIQVYDATYNVGDKVEFKVDNGSILPSPLIEDTIYYILRTTGMEITQFSLASAPNGNAIDITNEGYGAFRVNEYVDSDFWNSYVSINAETINNILIMLRDIGSRLNILVAESSV